MLAGVVQFYMATWHSFLRTRFVGRSCGCLVVPTRIIFCFRCCLTVLGGWDLHRLFSTHPSLSQFAARAGAARRTFPYLTLVYPHALYGVVVWALLCGMSGALRCLVLAFVFARRLAAFSLFLLYFEHYQTCILVDCSRPAGR